MIGELKGGEEREIQGKGNNKCDWRIKRKEKRRKSEGEIEVMVYRVGELSKLNLKIDNVLTLQTD